MPMWLLVSISFGGQVDLRRYAGIGARTYVHDGDTFSLGDVSLRLVDMDEEGIEASILFSGRANGCSTVMILIMNMVYTNYRHTGLRNIIATRPTFLPKVP